jgi:hypothetical protein
MWFNPDRDFLPPCISSAQEPFAIPDWKLPNKNHVYVEKHMK